MNNEPKTIKMNGEYWKLILAVLYCPNFGYFWIQVPLYWYLKSMLSESKCKYQQIILTACIKNTENTTENTIAINNAI